MPTCSNEKPLMPKNKYKINFALYGFFVILCPPMSYQSAMQHSIRYYVTMPTFSYLSAIQHVIPLYDFVPTSSYKLAMQNLILFYASMPTSSYLSAMLINGWPPWPRKPTTCWKSWLTLSYTSHLRKVWKETNNLKTTFAVSLLGFSQFL